jgi:transcriptional regulator with AAA-type ATPase domain/tetratricopeptide (TPR) repeat protein
MSSMVDLDELRGESTPIRAVRDQLRHLLARPQTGRRLPSIHVQGETGTGKGLVARLIHRLGPRASGPFVDVNCAAIPDALLEAELFGYERGAFTDARRAKPGLFQTAHRGTLFLDEIGLLPLALQAKLLTVIEEQSVRRLGSTTSEPVDVWILSATNADLRAAVRERAFREDLYHRLAVLTVALPPLRARGHDIVLLAELFLARACADYGLPSKRLSPDAQARLLAYPWPGNVRELANVAERVALLVEEDIVRADILSLPPVATRAPAEAADPAASASLEDAMRDHLRSALTQTGWNITRTAILLGISRNTLRARIRKFGLQGDAPPTPAAAPITAPVRPEPPRPGPPPEATPTRIRWERRRVTFLQAEILLPDAREPATNTRELETLMEKARGFGGEINEVSQSGINAIFGLEPTEDTAQRAAHAALTIDKAVERLRTETGAPLDVKIAIHTCQALVTQLRGKAVIDAEAKEDAQATIDTLLKRAQPGTIVLSRAVRPFLERRFKIHPGDAEERSADPVYRLLGPKPHGLGPAREMVAFVGRAQEMDMLQSQLAAAAAGHGQLVNVVGEAGIGKSRLLFEFRRRVATQGVGYIEGRCVSYGSAIPYLPIIDLIRKSFGITEAHGPDVAADKIRSVLHALGLDPHECTPSLMSLLGFKEGTAQLAGVSPEAAKARTFETVRRVTLAAARHRPLIIAVEDVHWIDRASEELLATVAEGLPVAPVLLITTQRPGYRAPWIEKSYASQVALPPLSPEESLRIARSMPPERRLPDALARVILERAEGNPFFLEELTRVVAERGELHPDIAVPDTVQGVLMARIERLPEAPRRLLQMASVFGRTPPLRVLAAMWGPAQDIDAQLRELGRLEFLYKTGAEEDAACVFKHALTQEVAYDSLLSAQRAELHAAAGRAIEELHADRLEDVYDGLAYHFARTRLSAKAVEYLTRSAEKAASRHAHVEAVAALESALARVPELAPELHDRLTLELVLRLANSQLSIGRFRETLDLLLANEHRVVRLADPGLTGIFHVFTGHAWNLMGDNERALAHSHKALEASRQAGDTAMMGRARYVLALASVWRGRPREVTAHGSEAVALLERAGERYWVGMTHWIMGLNYALFGSFDAALAEETSTRDIAAAIGSMRLQSYADWATGTIRAFMGDAELGIDACRRSLERSPDPFNTATALGFLGYAYLQNGQAGDAIAHLQQAIDLFARFRYRQVQGLFTAYLSEAIYLTGDLDGARRAAGEALELAQEAQFPYGKGLVHRLLGRIAQTTGSFEDARRLLGEAHALFASIEAQHEVARTELALAELAHAEGRDETRREHTARAYALFEQLGLPRFMERTQSLAASWGMPLPAGGDGARS